MNEVQEATKTLMPPEGIAIGNTSGEKGRTISLEGSRSMHGVMVMLLMCAMIAGSLSIFGIKANAASKSSITLDKTSISLNVGKTTTLKVKKVKNLSSKKCIFKSSNKKIVKISTSNAVNKVTIKGVKKGTAKIVVTSKANSRVKKTVKVTVKQPVTKLTMSKASLQLVNGGTAQLSVKVSPTNANNKSVGWTSRNTKIAKVTSKGKVTGVGRGSTYIIAKAKDGSGKTASCKVTVSQLVTGIKLDKSTLQMNVGGTGKLTAVITPTTANNKEVSWTSSNSKVVSVTASGNLTAISSGTADIVVKAKDGSNVTAVCKVTVTEPENPDSRIELNETEASVYAFQTLQLNALVYKADGSISSTPVVWSSANNKIASVDTNGLITGLAEGSTTIKAESSDGSISARCKITVLFVHVQKVTIKDTDPEASSTGMVKMAGDTWQFTATVEPENASNPKVNWYCTNSKISIDENGIVTVPTDITNTTNANFYAVSEDGNISSSKSAIYTIFPAYTGTTITLPVDNITLKVGETYDLEATVDTSVQGYSLVWARSGTTVSIKKLNTSGSKVRITALTPGLTIITASMTDARADCYITVVENEGEETVATE